jgi:hypothetical protein
VQLVVILLCRSVTLFSEALGRRLDKVKARVEPELPVGAIRMRVMRDYDRSTAVALRTVRIGL